MNSTLHTRTKFTNIPQKVKEVVWERDGQCCIYCGTHVPVTLAEAHVVPRSIGGLGIKENVITLCRRCHKLFDETKYRASMMKKFIRYLMRFYPDWNESDMKYKKGMQYNTPKGDGENDEIC